MCWQHLLSHLQFPVLYLSGCLTCFTSNTLLICSFIKSTPTLFVLPSHPRHGRTVWNQLRCFLLSYHLVSCTQYIYHLSLYHISQLSPLTSHSANIQSSSSHNHTPTLPSLPLKPNMHFPSSSLPNSKHNFHRHPAGQQHQWWSFLVRVSTDLVRSPDK